MPELAPEDAAHHQNRNPDAVAAEFNPFFEKADPQVICAEVGQGPRHLDESVAVSVRLHAAQYLDAGSDALPDGIEVVPQLFVVDLRPGQTHLRRKIYSFCS